MKKEYEIKKDESSLLTKILALVIWGVYYLLIASLAYRLIPKFNYIVTGFIIVWFIIVVIPMFYYPRWCLTENTMEIFLPKTISEKWKTIISKKPNIILEYDKIKSISIQYTKSATGLIYNTAYVLTFKITLTDNSEIVMDAMFNTDKTNFLNALNYIKDKEVQIIDSFGILDALNNGVYIYDYIKGLETK